MNRPGSRRAFTLVEILLVMAILAVISAITVPSFVRSIRGNRLRSAGRTVVAVTRYARSMALLHQNEIEVAFMLDKATIVVASHDRPMAALQSTGEVEVAIAEARARMSQSAAAAAGTSATTVREESGDASNEAPAPVQAASGNLPEVHLTRILDGVTIESVQKTDKDVAVEPDPSVVRVLYRTNGRCEPYEVRLRDHEQHRLQIKVDALSTPAVEQEAQ